MIRLSTFILKNLRQLFDKYAVARTEHDILSKPRQRFFQILWPCQKTQTLIQTALQHKPQLSKSDTVLNSEFKYHTHSYLSLFFKLIRPFKIHGYYDFNWICPQLAIEQYLLLNSVKFNLVEKNSSPRLPSCGYLGYFLKMGTRVLKL